MTKFKIPISKPNLTEGDFLEIKKCFNTSWISSKSPWVAKFEKSFAKNISKTKYAVAVNSGTSAIFLALKALGIGAGDEVIIPALTMIATVNAVSWAGAKPVLIDSTSTLDWNINPDKIEEKITNKTKAIIPVHLYGYSCDMKKINIVAKKHKLFVIEDAAEAMGASFQNKRVGSLGDISCFSLYSNKIITTGNGGMVATNDEKIYDLLKKLEFFDFNEKNHFKHDLIGYNLVLSGLQASLGYSQVKRFDKLLAKRRLIFAWYRKNLVNKNLKFIKPLSDDNPNYWFPALIAKDFNIKTRILTKLKNENIETREFFLPINMQPVYKEIFAGQDYPISEYFFKTGILLPSYYDLTLDNVKHICNLISDRS